MTSLNGKHARLVSLHVLLILLLPQAVLAQTPQRTGGDGEWTEIIRRTMPGVVSIIMYDAEGKPASSGSGFIVGSDGVVVTNHHVIKDNTVAQVITKQGEKFEVKGVIAYDRAKDFAILKIPAFDLPVLPFGNSNSIEVGESVLAIGDPKGVFTGTVSAGIISAKMREMEGSRWIQTSTPVSHGNSGGPLLNRRAEVIGVVSRGRNFDGQNFNFAVPINYVRGALQLGTAIKHSLAQVAQVEVALVRAEAEKTKEDFLKQFTPYDDPNGIFRLLSFKGWRTQHTRRNLDNGNVAVETIIAPPNAALAELGGYLSEGIRVQVILPAAGGHFTNDTIETWKTQFPESVLKGNPGFELTNSGMFILNDIPSKVYTFEGKSQRLPEPERVVSYVFGNQKALVLIEAVEPMSQLPLLDYLNQFAKSFELNRNFTGEVSGSSPGAVPFAGPPPANAVTLRDLELSFRSNLFDDTIRDARRFLETTPNSKEAHTFLGLSLLVKRDIDTGVSHLERAVLLGEPVTLPVKRLREPLLGHGLDEATVTLTADSVIVRSGKSSFQANFTSLIESRMANYNNQCPIVFLKGIFTETTLNSAKSKQGEKGFNLFPPSAALQPVQQGSLVYNMAACNDEGIITTGIAKLLYRLMANRR